MQKNFSNELSLQKIEIKVPPSFYKLSNTNAHLSKSQELGVNQEPVNVLQGDQSNHCKNYVFNNVIDYKHSLKLSVLSAPPVNDTKLRYHELLKIA